MKKTCLLFIFFVLIAFLAFSDDKEQQEIDFLLFLPNSSSRFVNEEQAGIQLDSLARHLTGRTLSPGQINVYGYAAFATNAVDPVGFSRARALFVIEQLEKRGVPRDLFADPVGYGTVDLWGGNTDETGRNLNRRVRVVLDGIVLIPEPSTGQVAESNPPPPTAPKPVDPEPEISRNHEKATGGSKRDIPWWILFPLLVFIVIPAIRSLLRKKPSNKTTEPKRPEQPKTVPVTTSEKIEPIIVPAATSEKVEPIIVPVATNENVETSKSVVCLEEEIRFRAYELYLRRNGQSENAHDDWCRAVFEICAKYEADGYQAYQEGGCWWASSFNKREK